jgi:hypothetical protein
LALEDRQNWPDRPSSVDVYILTDGGFDLATGHNDANGKREAMDAMSYVDAGFRTLWRDRRVRSVHIYGLVEQSTTTFPSWMRRNRSITEQWIYYWLKGAPKLDVVPASTSFTD